MKLFRTQCTYKEMCNLLRVNHKFSISVRSLKRILQQLNVKRKNIIESPIEMTVMAIIQIVTSTSGFNLGYRSIWRKLKSEYHLSVKRDKVLKFLRLIDPQGVEARSRYRLKRRQYSVRGPNYLWHVDGHDKLKPFGFAIHGCADGYSRKVIWLEVSTTNNKPEVIAHYYLKSLLEYGIPCAVRADKGTENNLIEVIQIALRYTDDDKRAKHNSFLRGKSTANERIEKWWKQQRNHTVEFYKRLFEEMEKSGALDSSNKVQIECLRFCFGPILKEDLKRCMKEWNEHRVRKQNDCKSPCGIPNVIYYWPEKYNGIKFEKNIDKEIILKLINQFTIEPKLHHERIEELIKMLVPNIHTPRSHEEAKQLINIHINNNIA